MNQDHGRDVLFPDFTAPLKSNPVNALTVCCGMFGVANGKVS